MTNMFNGMFGKIASGMCRLSMNGKIAVKTTNGYKSYNMDTNTLVNCDHFVFNIGEEFFFVIPTNKVDIGDIILANGKPKCVVKVENNTITVINYEDSTIETILPERHMFMGNTYFYGKIVSMFGNNFTKGKDGMKQMMSYMMMSEMMKGSGGDGATAMGGMGSILPMMMFMNGNGNGFTNMFEGMFDFDTNNDTAESEDK